MSKVTKTIEVEGKEVKAIKAEQLKAVKDQQAKMQALLIDVGFLEAKKHEVMLMQVEASKELEATKKELEDEYGPINIDLTDGSYTVVEKEEDAKPVMAKA